MVIDTIRQINSILSEAAHPRAGGIILAVLNTFAFGLLEFFMQSPMDRALEQIDELLMAQNDKAFHPCGLHMVSPRKSGLLQVSKSVLKPPDVR